MPKRRFHLSASDTFAALKYRNYRLWFIGQLISLVGTWMQSTAQGFLVYELTRSPAYLGYVGFAAGVPAWMFTLYAGLIADRMSKRMLLIITQSVMMILAFFLAGLTFSGLVQPWHIIGFAFMLGAANAFDAPARQAFVLEMVPREDLTNAIALNSTMFNSATAVGPAVAGAVYALFGPAWCFSINGISFIAVIVALALMQLTPIERKLGGRSALMDIADGFRFVMSQRTIRILILNLGVVSLFGMSFVTLMPAWAVNILGGDATTNGFLQSARGIGAVIGALVIAVLGRSGVRGKLFTLGSFVFPALLVVLTFTRTLSASLCVLVGVGFGVMVLLNISNSMVQTQVPDDMRGRVMSIYTLTFFGTLPIGALIVGTLATHINEPAAVIVGALIVFCASIWILWRVPELRAME